jgi:hypothetical protein
VIHRLAILGFGDMEVAPKISATLANFFAERPIEIRCWDEHAEACDAMCRVLRLFLKERELKYPVIRLEPHQALEKADALIMCGDLMTIIEPGILVPTFRFERGQDQRLDQYKFQALRWINQEDDPLMFMHEHQNLELLSWLNAF